MRLCMSPESRMGVHSLRFHLILGTRDPGKIGCIKHFPWPTGGQVVSCATSELLLPLLVVGEPEMFCIESVIYPDQFCLPLVKQILQRQGSRQVHCSRFPYPLSIHPSVGPYYVFSELHPCILTDVCPIDIVPEYTAHKPLQSRH